jgi:hypothetical protein
MSSPALFQNLPTMAEVKQIASIADPVIRNLRITECYHRLSLAMTRRIGSSANWCTFATWASKQAGQTIRGEDLLDKLAAASASDARFLHPFRALWAWLVRRGLFSPQTRLGRIVHAIHSPFDAFEFASDAVARGNLKVFEEIGLEFARYLERCPANAEIDSEAFPSFLKELRAGDPPEGQSLLRLAFERYHRAGRGAQDILLANLEIGIHEQTRLQPEIREAMEAGPNTADQLGERVMKALFPGIRIGAVLRQVSAALSYPASRFRRYVRELTCRVVTQELMVLTLPGSVLDLHRNLQVAFPESLVKLDNPALIQLVAGFEPPAGAPDDCGAQDWSALPQRMHFIIHLFRAFQERTDLYDSPFTAEQVHTLMSGKMPIGDL